MNQLSNIVDMLVTAKIESLIAITFLGTIFFIYLIIKSILSIIKK